jgi:shikimate 5-dehydrogenase
MIDKDTLIFGSFAKEAGNNGCFMFNTAFEHYKLNAIYKSFSVNNIEDAVKAARTLNFKGFAVTMPFKKEVIKYLDSASNEVVKIGAANTVVNINGFFKAFNTDYLAAKTILAELQDTKKILFILGNGGYAAAVRYAAKCLDISYVTVDRKTWHTINNIKDSIIYNCTPAANIKIDKSNIFIDCLITTETGKQLSRIQASYQFELYTGLKFPEL